jgi:hypothetical protein
MKSSSSNLFRRSVKRRVAVDECSAQLIVADSDNMAAQPLDPAVAVIDSDRLTRAADGIVLTVCNSDNMAAQPLHSSDAVIESDRLIRAAENANIIAQQLGDINVDIDFTSISCIIYITSEPLVNDDAEQVDESISKKRRPADDATAPHLCSNLSDRLIADHSFFQSRSFTAIGSANTQMHAHPLGLAHVFFDNCVVKMRLGHDLDRLIALSRIGPVSLHNIQSSGWIPSRETLLPAYVFLRWISSMVADEL